MNNLSQKEHFQLKAILNTEKSKLKRELNKRLKAGEFNHRVTAINERLECIEGIFKALNLDLNIYYGK